MAAPVAARDESWRSDPSYLGPISATPQPVIEALLELAGAGPGDAVYDLGCNDGRFVVSACAAFGCARGVGVEIDAGACAKARAAAADAGVSDRVDIVEGDCLGADVASADVVFLFLLPKGNEKISAKLRAELRPGTRVVTYIFKLKGDWEADLREVRAMTSTRKSGKGVDTSAYSKLHLYVLGSGDWEREAQQGGVPAGWEPVAAAVESPAALRPAPSYARYVTAALVAAAATAVAASLYRRGSRGR